MKTKWEIETLGKYDGTFETYNLKTLKDLLKSLLRKWKKGDTITIKITRK